MLVGYRDFVAPNSGWDQASVNDVLVGLQDALGNGRVSIAIAQTDPVLATAIAYGMRSPSGIDAVQVADWLNVQRTLHGGDFKDQVYLDATNIQYLIDFNLRKSLNVGMVEGIPMIADGLTLLGTAMLSNARIGSGAAVAEAGSGVGSDVAVRLRVAQLRSQIPANSQGRITMGVAVVEDAAGNQRVLISTSEPRGYLRPGVTLNPGETMVRGPGHAEQDIVDYYARVNNLRIISIGATRPVCPTCETIIIPTDAAIATPLQKPVATRVTTGTP